MVWILIENIGMQITCISGIHVGIRVQKYSTLLSPKIAAHNFLVSWPIVNPQCKYYDQMFIVC